MLEENIALLQARIQELEDPNIAAHRVYLHDPYQTFRQNEARGQMLSAGAQSSSVAPGVQWWDMEEPPRDVADTL